MEKLRSEVFVAIGKDDRRDYDLVADDPADGVSRTIYLGGDRFNDYPVTAIRPIHWANPAAIESCIRTLLSVVELHATGKEMLGPAEGIAEGKWDNYDSWSIDDVDGLQMRDLHECIVDLQGFVMDRRGVG